jgi:hypothetical protein
MEDVTPSENQAGKFTPKKEKTCPRCGDSYMPKTGTANMCYDCRKLTCRNPECKVVFSVKPHRVDEAKYCSVRCQKKHRAMQGHLVMMTPDQEQYIVDHYERKTAKEIAEDLGVNRRAVTYKLEVFTKDGRIKRTKRTGSNQEAGR